ncbi:MAG: hypothetical protein AAFR38_00670 [Planctomycetota bacterium]
MKDLSQWAVSVWPFAPELVPSGHAWANNGEIHAQIGLAATWLDERQPGWSAAHDLDADRDPSLLASCYRAVQKQLRRQASMPAAAAC